jgi:hypothetical protein
MKERKSGVVLSVTLAVWLVVAIAVSAAGALRHASPLMIPVIILALSTLALVACWKLSPIREWVGAVELRWLVLLHVTRFIGLYFLVASNRGQIPEEWAVPAGIGDSVIAAGALLIFLAGISQRVPLLLWNTLGLVDIVFVILSAMRLGLRDPSATIFLRELPLSLLPTFLVPLIVATHLLIFARISRRVAADRV